MRQCQKDNCSEPAIPKGKYCNIHRTNKKNIRTSILTNNITPQSILTEYDELEQALKLSKFMFEEENNYEKEKMKNKLEEDRLLKIIQENEYIETQRLDIERIKFEKERKLKEENEKKLKEENEKKQIDLKKAKIVYVDEKNCYNIKINFPNGNKIIRKFKIESNVEDIRNVIDIFLYENKINIKNYDLIANFPFKRLTSEDLNTKIEEFTNFKNFILIVENLDS